MRLRKTSTILFFPLVATGLFGCTSEAPQLGSGNAGLWEISFDGNKNYLFASLPYGSDDLYPLPQVVEEAFANATTIIFETNPDGMSKKHFQLFYEANGKYSERGLCDHLSAGTAALLRAYCAENENKMPFPETDRLKPWTVAVLIQHREANKLGLDEEKGISKHFSRKLTNSKKTIVELQTMRSRMEMFARMEPQAQLIWLTQTLEQVKEFSNGVNEEVKAWKSGNLDEIHRAFVVEPRLREVGLEEVNFKFYDEMSIRMAAQIAPKIKGKESVFMAVGPEHISGENGILKQLEQKGFTVKQVNPVR